MKSPKTYEMLSHAHPGMKCPSCGSRELKSDLDYSMEINLFGGGEKSIKVHAIICEDCDYVGFSKETLQGILKEGVGTAGTVQNLHTIILH